MMFLGRAWIFAILIAVSPAVAARRKPRWRETSFRMDGPCCRPGHSGSSMDTCWSSLERPMRSADSGGWIR